MNILRRGDVTLTQKVKRFACRECGCVFEAERGEYKIEQDKNETVPTAKCPCCNLWVWGCIDVIGG